MASTVDVSQLAGGGWTGTMGRRGVKDTYGGRRENPAPILLKDMGSTGAVTRPIKRGATVPDLDNYKVERKERDTCVKRKPLEDFVNVTQSGSDPTSWGQLPGPVTRSRSKLARLGLLPCPTPAPVAARTARRTRRTTRSRVKTALPAAHNEISRARDRELEHASASTRRGEVMSWLPDDVMNVDAVYVNRDANFTPAYAMDIMEHLRLVESRWSCPEDFLHSNAQVTPKMRSVLMDWLIQVQDHKNLEDETLHLCVALIDRFLAVQAVTLDCLQLLGITCLFIATKVVERFPPEAVSLCHLTDDAYNVKQVLQWERDVLHTLDFAVILPVATVFLDRFLMVERGPEELRHLCCYLLDLSLTHVHFVQQRPSLVAASAVYVGRAVMCLPPPWTPSLAFYSQYRAPQLASCAALLARALLRAKTSKHQGARAKFSEACFKNVANNPDVIEHPALHSLAVSYRHVIDAAEQ